MSFWSGKSCFFVEGFDHLWAISVSQEEALSRSKISNRQEEANHLTPRPTAVVLSANVTTKNVNPVVSKVKNKRLLLRTV